MMANSGFAQHQQMLLKLCRICGERLMKTNDKYERSFSCDDKRDLIIDSFAICSSFKELSSKCLAGKRNSSLE